MKRIQRWKHLSVAKYDHEFYVNGWCEGADVAELEDRLDTLESAVGAFVNATGDDKKRKLAALIAVYDGTTPATTGGRA